MSFDRAAKHRQSQLGHLLIEKGMITATQLDDALRIQAVSKRRLGEILIETGSLSHAQLDKVLTKQRWLRSLVAGIVMAAAPTCLSAAELATDFHFEIESHPEWLNDKAPAEETWFFDSFSHQPYNSIEWKSNKTAFQKKLGETQLQIGLTRSDFESPYFSINPALTLVSTEEQSRMDGRDNLSHTGGQRFDHYKNELPAIYRLTIKGYSLYEATENSVETLQFNRISNYPFKDYEIMFSVTKNF